MSEYQEQKHPTLEEEKTLTGERDKARQYVGDLIDVILDREIEVSFARNEDIHAVLDYLLKKAKDPNSELYRRIFDHEHLPPHERAIHPGIIELLERRLSDHDTSVTGLPRREIQSDILREKIADLGTPGTVEHMERAKHLAFLSFDIRGLKLMNDAMKDHSYGDEYLRLVTNKTKEVILPVLEDLCGENGSVNFARDGGDEFSFVIQSDGHDFTSVMRAEDLTLLTNHMGKYTDLFITHMGEREMPLVELLSNFVMFRLAYEKNTVIAKEKLEEFARKGEADDYRLPEGFDMHLHVACGGTTLYETIHDVNPKDFKKGIEAAESSQTSIPESVVAKGKEGLFAINNLLGAMRSRADRREYAAKEAQNDAWLNSDSEHDMLMIKIISRNDVTISLAIKAREERAMRKAKEAEAEMMTARQAETQQALDECNETVTRLKMG